MTSVRTSFALALALALLGACVPDPRSYESPPVEVETPQGVVTCQLYSPEIVAWDRAIDRPDTMSYPEADEVCRAEGLRQKYAQ